MPSLDLSGSFRLKYSNDPLFLQDFLEKTEAVLRLKFTTIETIEDYVRLGDPVTLDGELYEARPLSYRLLDYPVLLSALGRMSDAEQASRRALEFLAPYASDPGAEAEIPHHRGRPPSKTTLRLREVWQSVIARQRELSHLVQRRDRAGIGELLRSWEQKKVKNLKIEHLWEPTPFPVELGEGDTG